MEKQELQELQEKLEKLTEIRRRISRKRWENVMCDFSMKRKATVMFFNSEIDFSESGFPSLGIAVDVQQKKMGKDIISLIGEENMDELIEVL